MWTPIIGRSFTPESFIDYCGTIIWNTFAPSFVVLHNTGSPTLAQRPDGLTHQHILNLESFYRDTNHWSAGPHLFVDDRQIWVFTPLDHQGVHSPSWNNVAFGVEMLGDFTKESFSDGRGLNVKNMAISALASLHLARGLDPNGLRLHKEDPKTTHRDCPGENVDLQDMKDMIIAEIARRSV